MVLLPSARRPNQGNRCACRDLEIETVQNRLPVSVAKDDVVWKTRPCRQRGHVDAPQLTKLNFTIHMLTRHSILRLAYGWHLLKDSNALFQTDQIRPDDEERTIDVLKLHQ